MKLSTKLEVKRHIIHLYNAKYTVNIYTTNLETRFIIEYVYKYTHNDLHIWNQKTRELIYIANGDITHDTLLPSKYYSYFLNEKGKLGFYPYDIYIQRYYRDVNMDLILSIK